VKKILTISIVILFFSLYIVSFANENIDDWRFSKEIYYSDDNEYKSFFLDEEIYRYVKEDLSDIRIVNEKNEFVPYYMFNKNSKKTRQAKFEISLENKDTLILIKNKNHLNINYIKIISQDDFKRNYDIYYKNNKYEEFIKVDSGKIHRINLKNYKEEKNIIMLDFFSKYIIKPNTIKIIIHNKDDRPINIENINMNYYIDKIVFKKDTTSKYKVLFGSESATSPSYDIENYKNYIEKENQGICTLSDLTEKNENNKEKGYKKINHKLILNVTVILISLILVMIIMRRSTEKEL